MLSQPFLCWWKVSLLRALIPDEIFFEILIWFFQVKCSSVVKPNDFADWTFLISLLSTKTFRSLFSRVASLWRGPMTINSVFAILRLYCILAKYLGLSIPHSLRLPVQTDHGYENYCSSSNIIISVIVLLVWIVKVPMTRNFTQRYVDFIAKIA